MNSKAIVETPREMGECRAGIVQSLDGETAVVTIPRKGVCDKCAGKGACFAMGTDTPDAIRAANTAGAAVGDQVEIQFPENSKVKATFFVYLVPMFGLLAGGFALQALFASLGFDSDDGAILGCVAGFLVGLGGSMLFDRREKTKARFAPEITHIVRSNATFSPVAKEAEAAPEVSN